MVAIEVNHNVEMGHRLSEQPESKCFHLHGHSWRVHMTIDGPMDEKGMVLEFGEVKRKFREYLDTNFDHHMLLNPSDPLLRYLDGLQRVQWGITLTESGDPTVERFAILIWNWAKRQWPGNYYRIRVKVYEASTNAAIAGDLDYAG